MYCKNCGKPVEDTAKFCPNCGTMLVSPGPAYQPNPQQINQQAYVTNTMRTRGDIVSDKWIWALATVPLFMGWVVPIVLAVLGITDTFISTLVVIGLNITFITLDVKEVKNAGMNVDSWLYLGILLVPVYLFVRESKTNRNNAPGIVWCVLFFFSLFV